jgi:hypothetical protein
MVDMYQTIYKGDHLLRVVNFALSQPFAEQVSRFSRFSDFNLLLELPPGLLRHNMLWRRRPGADRGFKTHFEYFC